MSATGARYLEPQAEVKSTLGSPLKLLPFVLSLMAALLLAAQFVVPSLVSSTTQGAPLAGTASAGTFGILCGGKDDVAVFGHKTSFKGLRLVGWPSQDAKNRTWTLQEAYGANIRFTSYYGEGGKDAAFVEDVGEERGKGVGNWDKVIGDLKKPRNAGNCLFGLPGVAMGNLGLGLADTISSVTQSLAVYAFDAHIICDKAVDPAGEKQGNCINLLKIIGGTGSSGLADSYNRGGIIGALTSSIYMPLMTLLVTVSAVGLAWQGLAKRRFRKTVTDILWIVGCFIFGLMFLLNPMLLAKAPMAASNVIGACIIGSFNGDNCATGGASEDLTTSTGGFTSDKICVSRADVGADEKMAMAVNSLSCSIWKAFVLDPWSQGQFGRSFDEMDTANPDIQAVFAKINKDSPKTPLGPDDFAVSLGTGRSMDEQGAWTDMTQGPVIKNVAAYQLYLSTKARGGAEEKGKASALGYQFKDGTFDKRWMKLAVFTANTDAAWENWPVSFSGGLQKVRTGAFAVLIALLGGIIIAFISIMALVYYLISVLLMAFAPLFLLVGVNPGRGKVIMLGWLETVVSNVLKYLASAVYLIVTIAFYGSVLSSSSGVGTTLIYVLILSAALWLYRKEFIELMGRTSMGGQRMSNHFSSVVNSGLNRSKRLALATTGGALGSVASTGSLNPVRNTAAAYQGMRDAASRDLRRGNGLIAQASKTSHSLQTDNKRDLKADADRAATRAEGARHVVNRAEETISNTDMDIRTREADLAREEVGAREAAAQLQQVHTLEDRLIVELKQSEPFNVRLEAIQSELVGLATEKKVALEAGDHERVQAIDTRAGTLIAERRQLASFTSLSEERRQPLALLVEQEENLKRETIRARNATDPEERAEALRAAENLRAEREKTLGSLEHPADAQTVRSVYADRYAREAEIQGISSVDAEEAAATVQRFEQNTEAYREAVDRRNEAVDQRSENLEDVVGNDTVASVYSSYHTDLDPGDSFRNKDRRKLDERAEMVKEAKIQEARAAYDKVEAKEFTASGPVKGTTPRPESASRMTAPERHDDSTREPPTPDEDPPIPNTEPPSPDSSPPSGGGAQERPAKATPPQAPREDTPRETPRKVVDVEPTPPAPRETPRKAVDAEPTPLAPRVTPRKAVDVESTPPAPRATPRRAVDVDPTPSGRDPRENIAPQERPRDAEAPSSPQADLQKRLGTMLGVNEGFPKRRLPQGGANNSEGDTPSPGLPTRDPRKLRP